MLNVIIFWCHPLDGKYQHIIYNITFCYDRASQTESLRWGKYTDEAPTLNNTETFASEIELPLCCTK